MKVQTVGINQINPAAYNPRVDLKPGDAEYEKLKSSIMRWGCVENLVWNMRTGNLVGGHQRFKILIDMGQQEIEVVVVDLPLEEEKALNIALNKISGDWDHEKLTKLLDELSQVPEFDVKLTGFDQPEINSLLDEYAHPQEERASPEALAPLGGIITQPGELILIGEHRILCGDAANPDDVKRLIGDARSDLVFTDPPYNCQYSRANRPTADGRLLIVDESEKLQNDDLPQPEYESMLRHSLGNVVPYLNPGAAMYIWNGHRQFGPMHEILLGLNVHISCVITWAKESFALGFSDYNQQTEFCLYGWLEDNGAHRWYGPDNESTLWQVKREAVADLYHPTQKPLALAHRALRNSTKRGDIVLDLFMGSGTTLIGAAGLNRVCYGMEISPRWCDVAIRRYIDYVGRENAPEPLVKRYMESGV